MILDNGADARTLRRILNRLLTDAPIQKVTFSPGWDCGEADLFLKLRDGAVLPDSAITTIMSFLDSSLYNLAGGHSRFAFCDQQRLRNLIDAEDADRSLYDDTMGED